MKRRFQSLPLAVALSLLAATGAAAATATATLAGPDGTTMGTVMVEDTGSGQALVTVTLEGVPTGAHAIHIHESGDCSAEGFTSAGGHWTGGHDHGVMAEAGPHAGDLPNIEVPESGMAKVAHFKPDVTVEAMLDEDGASFIVHAGADDYESQPSGDAGGRIACGVFEAE
ncbi:superoxide dismutase family protein [Vannielia litorea]|uniref:superoxide dismutase family protein n=1 Tax=Vannielia litorea TaxID=1217970 RepID=UPI001BD03FC9|nr:superoxide dismutase family protein [Vannielia litorea]MBS8227535.1 superoxide dismutase family protein [Vannielia litorea]